MRNRTGSIHVTAQVEGNNTGSGIPIDDACKILWMRFHPGGSGHKGQEILTRVYNPTA